MTTISKSDCSHAPAEPADPVGDVCAECGAPGPVRVCLSCGHVGCCDSSAGHATAHAKTASHPLIRSLPLSSHSFTWCYECEAYLS